LQNVKANEEFIVKDAQVFKCPITKTDQSVVVYLLNARGEPLTGGVIPLCKEFPSLEPSEDTTTIFEPQQLR